MNTERIDMCSAPTTQNKNEDCTWKKEKLPSMSIITEHTCVQV